MGDARIRETGRVSRVGAGGAVEIRLSPTAACAKCGLCQRAEGGHMRLALGNRPNLKVGQKVVVTFPYRSVWKQAFAVFGLPLLCMFGGMGLGIAVAGGLARSGTGGDSTAASVAAAVGAFAGLGLGIIIAGRCERSFRNSLRDETGVEVLEES